MQVWTAAELYTATSMFSESLSGHKQKLYSVVLDAEMKQIDTVKEESSHVRTLMHEGYSWCLPPRENLGHPADLVVLEPLIVLLGDQIQPEVVTAAHINLPVALSAFMSAGKDINASDGATLRTALHCAARRADVDMMKIILADPKVNVDQADEMGMTALHFLSLACHSLLNEGHPGLEGDQLAKAQNRTREGIKLMLEAGADPFKHDVSGNSSIYNHATNSDDESFFPGVSHSTPDCTDCARFYRPQGRIPSLHRKVKAPIRAKPWAS